MEYLRMKTSVALLCLVMVFAAPQVCSGARALVKEELVVAPQKDVGFDHKLDYPVANNPRVPCEEGEGEIRSWSASANTASEDLVFRFNKNRTRDVVKDGSAEAGKVVFNILPKGPVAPSGPSPRHNAVINGQRLSKSKPSPGVGHMQISKINKSGESLGVVGDQGAGKKRVLRSTPSRGAGH